MEFSAKFAVIKDRCVTRTIAGETIVVPVRSQVGDLDSIYTLNEVGSTIWNLLDGQTSVEQIAGVLALEYDVTAAQAAQDTVEFLHSLETAGLICPCV